MNTGASTRSPLVKLDKRTPQLWQVTIANPPFNLVVPEIVSALHAIVKDMDREPEVKVIVFRSELEGYFLNHFDLTFWKTPQRRRVPFFRRYARCLH